MVAAQAAPNDYGKTLTDEEEDKDEEENPKPNARPKWYTSHTQNRQPPQWCSSSPFIAQGGKTVYKRGETKYPLSFNGDISLDFRGGENDGS